MKPLIPAMTVAIALTATTAGAQSNSLYASIDASGARFGANIGAGISHRGPPPFGPDVEFGGKATLSCSGIDYKAFLNGFRPQELLSDLTGSLRNGAQAAATNYVIALAYANPTIASVLDMMDQRYSARFQAFAEQCNAAQARARGESEGARRAAAGQDQCFSRRVGEGASPTEAYRDCAKAATVASMNLPAGLDLKAFLRDYSSIDVTRELEVLLGLLSDARTSADGVQIRPPALSIATAKANVEDRVANAINAIVDGTAPDDIPDCAPEALAAAMAGPNDRCIPASAGALVRSPAFLGARLLPAPEQALYAAALAQQVASVDMRARVVELRQQITKLAPKPATAASADDVGSRRDALLREIDRLEVDARALEELAAAKAQLARTQILAMQRAGSRLQATQASAERMKLADRSAFVGGLRALFGLAP